ncbi:MAG: PDZ domain-containing protein [Planctomycetes bacterium]|nr:PDZ domain-containing protein [Planctomycetota bacterium]
MTRLNFTLIWCVGFISLLCHQRVEHHSYGRYFYDALETIHGQGLEPIDRQPLFDAAIRGMTSQLDQHSGFVSRKNRQAYQSELDQHFSGVGIEVHYDAEKKRIVVANTIVGHPHPAHDAGMRRGDQIVAVNGVPVAGKPLDEAMQLIKGPAGETVRVSVLHEGETKPVELNIERQEIQVDSVVGDVRRDDGSWSYLLDTKPPIAYVRIKSFGEGTSQQLRTVLEKLQKEGKLQALVVPMAVLVNGESASASEIFAACMQDHARAVIVGSRSYGKGSVQKMYPMESGESILKLTTASYWRPSNKNIHKGKLAKDSEDWGVRPDTGYDLPLTEEQEKKRREARSDRDAFRIGATAEKPPKLDPQLAKAVELLEAKLREKN